MISSLAFGRPERHSAAMTEPVSADAVRPEFDARRVRLGLALVTAAVVVAAVLLLIVDDPVGRLVMGAIVVAGVVRAFLLSRSLRRT